MAYESMKKQNFGIEIELTGITPVCVCFLFLQHAPSGRKMKGMGPGEEER